MKDLLVWLAIVQGGYYLLTGLWPLVSMGTFMAMTGPKTDTWLVRTVGILIAVMGAVLLTAGLREAVTLEVMILAVGAAAGLTWVDTYHSLTRVISKIYLGDAVIEIMLIAFWALAWGSRA